MPGAFDDPSLIGTAAQVLNGVVSGVTSLFQAGKAKRIERNAIRPIYKIEEPIKDNQALAEAEAGQGFSDNTLNAYNRSNERNMESSIDAIIKSGGSANNVAELYSNAQAGNDRVAQMNEELRAQRVARLFQQNEQYANAEDTAWQVNKYAPWADQMQRAQQLRNNAAANASNAFNSLSGAAASYASSRMYGADANHSSSSIYPPHQSKPEAPIAYTSPYTPLPNPAASSVVDRYPGLQVGYSYGSFIGPQQPH